MSAKYPIKVAELPEVEFFAILIPESISTGPEYGDSVDSWRIEVFHNKKEWEDEIVKLKSNRGYSYKEFQAVRINPAKIKTTIVVE